MNIEEQVLFIHLKLLERELSKLKTVRKEALGVRGHQAPFPGAFEKNNL